MSLVPTKAQREEEQRRLEVVSRLTKSHQVELEGLKAAHTASAQRLVSNLLTPLYHLAKGGTELSAMVMRRISYLPVDERARAADAVRHIQAAYSILDSLVADAGNNTPHEKPAPTTAPDGS